MDVEGERYESARRDDEVITEKGARARSSTRREALAPSHSSSRALASAAALSERTR